MRVYAIPPSVIVNRSPEARHAGGRRLDVVGRRAVVLFACSARRYVSGSLGGRSMAP